MAAHAIPPPPASAIRPDATDLIAMRRLALARPAAQPIAGAARAGVHRSANAGRGMTFAGLRPYQPGDDPRTLDWRHTARRQRPYTKVFEEERERPVLLLVDLGPTMAFGTRAVFKSVQAARIAALLAWAAVSTGDRVGGVVVTGTTLRHAPVRARDAGALALIRALSEPSEVDTPSATAYTHATAALRQGRPAGGEVIVISDFASPDALLPALRRLRSGGPLRLIRVADPLELGPPPIGRYPVADATRTGTLVLDTESQRAAYAEACHARSTQLASAARQLEAPLLTIATDDAPTAALAVLGPRR